MPDAAKHSWPMPAWATPALVAVIGLTLSLLGYIAVRNATVTEIRGQFEENATRRLGQLQDAVNINTTLLHSIEGLYAASQFVSREEFEIFVRNQPLTKSRQAILAWVPRISPDERSAIVAQARNDGINDFRVWSHLSEGGPVPQAEADQYPIFYLEPFSGNELLLGFDLASDSESRKALARARDNGEPAATSRISVLPDSAESGTVMIAYPRYKAPLPPDTLLERRRDLVGYAVGLFNMSDLFEGYSGPQGPPDVDVFIYDLFAVPTPELLYARYANGEASPVIEPMDVVLDSYHWSGTMYVGGHTWLAVFRPVDEYPPAFGDWRAWVTAAFGIFLTFLLTGYEWRRSTHTRRIEALAADLSRSYARLEREIAERMLAEEQLRQSQKLEVVGKLTGGIAHDFNNLLTVILGNLETASERTGESGAVASQIRTAINAAVRGAALTQRLLAFARRQVLEPERLDLNSVIAAMLELIRRSLGVPIEVKTSLAKDLWPAMADRNQVENALLNLVVNARDAMPSGGTLMIETQNVTLDAAYARQHSEVTPGDYVVLAVSDSGIGMTPETQERAIEPFFTTKEPGKGTGLGLSSIYGFARQSGGHLRIYSELGLGTTVRLYLPRAPGPEAAAAEKATGAGTYAGSETILVTEDEPEVRAIAVAHLSESGYRVIEARDAAAALAAAKSVPKIDLLLTGVVLTGGMNGQYLAAALRERNPGLKVLFMSGYAEQERRPAERAETGFRLVQKPFRKSDLLSAIREALDSDARG